MSSSSPSSLFIDYCKARSSFSNWGPKISFCGLEDLVCDDKSAAAAAKALSSSAPQEIALSFTRLSDEQVASVVNAIADTSNLKSFRLAVYLEQTAACKKIGAAVASLLDRAKDTLEAAHFVVEKLPLTFGVFLPALSRCTKLRHLSFGCVFLADDIAKLKRALEEIPLETLWFGSVFVASPENELFLPQIAKLVKSFKNSLKSLAISIFPGPQDDAKGFSELGEAIGSLARLSAFSFTGGVSSKVETRNLLLPVLKDCGTLRELTILCRYYSWIIFMEEGLHLPNLERLTVLLAKRIRPKHLSAILNALGPNVEHLQLDCDDGSDDLMTPEICSKLASFEKLKRLALNIDCPGMEKLLWKLEGHQNLEQLAIYLQINEGTFAPAVLPRTLTFLRVALDGSGAFRFVTSLQGLENLKTFAMNLTYASGEAEENAKHWKSLIEHLSSNCERFTIIDGLNTGAVPQLLSLAPQLRSLKDFRYCPYTTEEFNQEEALAKVFHWSTNVNLNWDPTMAVLFHYVNHHRLMTDVFASLFIALGRLKRQKKSGESSEDDSSGDEGAENIEDHNFFKTFTQRSTFKIAETEKKTIARIVRGRIQLQERLFELGKILLRSNVPKDIRRLILQRSASVITRSLELSL